MAVTAAHIRSLGYARVSICGQILDVQLEQLRVDGYGPIYHGEARRDADCRPARVARSAESRRCGDGEADRPCAATPGLFVAVKYIAGVAASSTPWPSPSAHTGTSTGRLMLVVLGTLPTGCAT
jgi:hypothetical protein